MAPTRPTSYQHLLASSRGTFRCNATIGAASWYRRRCAFPSPLAREAERISNSLLPFCTRRARQHSSPAITLLTVAASALVDEHGNREDLDRIRGPPSSRLMV